MEGCEGRGGQRVSGLVSPQKMQGKGGELKQYFLYARNTPQFVIRQVIYQSMLFPYL